MSEPDLDELRAELDAFAQPEKKAGRSAREERIIAGFEEIQRFVETHGHPPLHGEDRDIFERIYAVRLDRLCALEECRTLLQPLDYQGLLTEGAAPAGFEDSPDVDELAAELEEAAGASDITELRHVRTSADKRAAEEIANRQRCEDFDRFKPLFAAVQREIEDGITADSAVRTESRNQAGELVHRRRPKGLCRRNGRNIYEPPRPHRCAASRDFRQWHGEQHAHAVIAARAP